MERLYANPTPPVRLADAKPAPLDVDRRSLVGEPMGGNAIAPRAKSSIARRTFGDAWSELCQRFDKRPDRDETLRVLAFLEAMGVTEEDAIAAARSLWATARFFPRPADFLALQAERDWRDLIDLANEPPPVGTTEEQYEEIRQRVALVNPRAFATLKSFGGLDAIRRSRDIPRLRRDFIDAYERAIAHDAAVALR